LRQAIERSGVDGENIQSYLKEAATSQVTLDAPRWKFAMRKRLEAQAALFAEHPDNIEIVQNFRKHWIWRNPCPSRNLWKHRTFRMRR